MPDKIRWGILSTARIGQRRVIPAMQQSSNGEVVAVASRSEDKAKAFAEPLGIPKVYGSYEELIADPDIDAIYNPLPNSAHAEWSIKCAEAGKPVLCEKPLASDAAESQTIVDAFAERDLLFAEAFMYRFHPQTERIQQMVAEGAIGQLQAIQSAFTFPISDEANIRLSKDLAGGAVMDVGCYCINLMRHMTGEEPDTVRAIARFGDVSQVDETLSGIVSFPSGVVGHFDSGLRTYRRHMYELRGTEGYIIAQEGFTMPADKETSIFWEHNDIQENITIPTTNHYQLMAEDFADALLNGRPPRFLPQDAVENMRVIDNLLASARQ